MYIKRIIPIFLPLFFSTGCVNLFGYKYISLEQIEGIKVVSYGHSELATLKLDGEMPIRYELLRENYILILELDKKNHWPSIFVSAKSLDGLGFTIEATTRGSCGGFDSLGIDYKLDNFQALRYVWSPGFNLHCAVSGNADYPDDQVISFKVKDQKGKILGEEKLPFALIKNGVYYVIDSI